MHYSLKLSFAGYVSGACITTCLATAMQLLCQSQTDCKVAAWWRSFRSAWHLFDNIANVAAPDGEYPSTMPLL